MRARLRKTVMEPYIGEWEVLTSDGRVVGYVRGDTWAHAWRATSYRLLTLDRLPAGGGFYRLDEVRAHALARLLPES